jgi:diguanylate cyclase (GGDEF)-like protein
MRTPELLLVDDDPSMIQVMARVLHGIGRMRFATSGPQALQRMAESPPDLVLLDGDMPGMDGFEVCRRMKAAPELQDIPVIFVTGMSSTAQELRGLEAGASDFITKPVSEPLLIARSRTQLRVKALTDQLRELAATDGLTGLSNRRSFDEALRREWARSQRSGRPLALLMLDVDHFKAYNDHYGHPAGDDCLRQVAQCLKASMQRRTDMVARYGGEEFAALLPETDTPGAHEVAAGIHAQLRALALPHAASQTAPLVTVSIGIGTFGPRSQGWHAELADADPASLLKAADAALYAAKSAGRARSAHQDVPDPTTNDPAAPASEAPAPGAAP